MTARSPVKINTVFLKEWMAATLSATLSTSKDWWLATRVVQQIGNPKKNQMPKVAPLKKQLFLIRSCCQILSIPYNPKKNVWLQDVFAINIVALNE